MKDLIVPSKKVIELWYTLKGEIGSFELWMLYYNYLRIKGNSAINSLEFIDKRNNISNLLMPVKWTMIIKYSIQNFIA